MKSVPSLIVMIGVMAGVAGDAWGQDRRPTMVMVHDPSWAYRLTVYAKEPTTIRFDHPVLWVTSTHNEWLAVELDSATGLITLTFTGEALPDEPATIRVRTTECLYVLRAKVTDDEMQSHPLKHFRRIQPPGLTSTHSAGPLPAAMPLGDPLPYLGIARLDRTEAVTYHIKAMAGVLWAESSRAANQRAAAPMTGLGLEVRKGYAPSLAVDGELLVASSGEAVFHDADSTDQIVQTTRLARLGVGARLRLGDHRIPFVRVGLGLEGSWSQLHTPAPSGTWRGPELAWALQLTLALGFDLELGDHTLAGADLSATGRRSIAGTLHIGYSP